MICNLLGMAIVKLEGFNYYYYYLRIVFLEVLHWIYTEGLYVNFIF